VLSPNLAGELVYLERRQRGVWQPVASQRLSATSTFRFTIHHQIPGTYTYRVSKPADDDHAAARSPTRTLRVG